MTGPHDFPFTVVDGVKYSFGVRRDGDYILISRIRDQTVISMIALPAVLAPTTPTPTTVTVPDGETFAIVLARLAAGEIPGESW